MRWEAKNENDLAAPSESVPIHLKHIRFNRNGSEAKI